jgi:hypothetical protein
VQFLGPMPWNPAEVKAVSAHIYRDQAATRVASVHFYGGPDRCDVGIDADMTAGLLQLIIDNVSVRI